jgi:hypothetical protein
VAASDGTAFISETPGARATRRPRELLTSPRAAGQQRWTACSTFGTSPTTPTASASTRSTLVCTRARASTRGPPSDRTACSALRVAQPSHSVAQPQQRMVRFARRRAVRLRVGNARRRSTISAYKAEARTVECCSVFSTYGYMRSLLRAMAFAWEHGEAPRWRTERASTPVPTWALDGMEQDNGLRCPSARSWTSISRATWMPCVARREPGVADARAAACRAASREPRRRYDCPHRPL